MKIDDLTEPNETWFKENWDKIPINLPNPFPESGEGTELAPEPEKPSLIYSLDSLLAQDFPKIEWIVEHLIPVQGLVALSGVPGSYKSFITQHLALCVASGKQLFGKYSTKQGKVLIIDKENQRRLIQQRFKLLDAQNYLDISFLDRDFYVEDAQLVKNVCDIIRTQSISLVIIDSLIRIYKGKNENSSNDMAIVTRELKSLQDAGAAVLFTHHHRKQSFLQKNTSSESMRGSSDILASVDCHLAVDKLEEEIKITQSKLRQEMALKPFKIKLTSSVDHCEFSFCGEVAEEKEKIDQARTDILTALEEGEASRTSLIDRFQGLYGSKTIDAALKSFTTEEATVRIGEHGRKYYSKAGNESTPSLFETV